MIFDALFDHNMIDCRNIRCQIQQM